jgi:hypothetical protein
MLLVIIILALINYFSLRANIFVLAVEIVKLYAGAKQGYIVRKKWKKINDAIYS